MSIDTTTLLPEVSHVVEPPQRDATVMELAAVVAGSRDFPDCRTPEKAAVRILAGREMGVGPINSVIGIRVQNGRVSMDATLMAGAIKRSGRYDYRVTEHTNEACSLEFSENGQKVGDSAFTWEDAKKANLDKKSTWKEYPRNMLFARALSNGARWFCPGIFGGAIYTHEELGYAVDDEGRAVETDAGTDSGSDLCTREQRQQIQQMALLIGEKLPEYLRKLGIKLLDELSSYEADKEIKKLSKRLEKAKIPYSPNGPATATQAASAPDTMTPAQQTIADAEIEAAAPSTPEQQQQIIELVEELVGEDAVRETILVALEKRNCTKLAQLNHLQAAALIEAVQAKLEAANHQPPFDPTPGPGSN